MNDWPHSWTFEPEPEITSEDNLTVKVDYFPMVAQILEDDKTEICIDCGKRFKKLLHTKFLESDYCRLCRAKIGARLTRMEKGYKRSCPYDLKEHLFSNKKRSFTGFISYHKWKKRK